MIENYLIRSSSGEIHQFEMDSALDNKVESTAQRVFRDMTETLCNLGTATYETVRVWGVSWGGKLITSITGIGSMLFGLQMMKISVEKIRNAQTTVERVEHIGRLFFGMGWVVNGLFATLLELSKHVVKFGIQHAAKFGGPIGGIVAAGSGLCADVWKLYHLLSKGDVDKAEVKKTLVSMVSNLCMLIAPILILALIANPYTAAVAIVVMGLVATVCPVIAFAMDHYREKEKSNDVTSTSTRSSSPEPDDVFSKEDQEECVANGLPEWKVVKTGGPKNEENSQRISDFLNNQTGDLKLDFPDELVMRIYGYRRQDYKNQYRSGFYDFNKKTWGLEELKKVILGDLTRSGEFYLGGMQITEENIEQEIFNKIPLEGPDLKKRNRILSCLASCHQGAAATAYMKIAEESEQYRSLNSLSNRYDITLDFETGDWDVKISQEHDFPVVEKRMSSLTEISENHTTVTWTHA